MDKILIRICGRVQGIGYRWFVIETAKKYNFSGWVKNLDDGNVECAVKGLKEDIEKFISDIKTKHPLAIVEKVEILRCDENIPINKDFLIKQ